MQSAMPKCNSCTGGGVGSSLDHGLVPRYGRAGSASMWDQFEYFRGPTYRRSDGVRRFILSGLFRTFLLTKCMLRGLTVLYLVYHFLIIFFAAILLLFSSGPGTQVAILRFAFPFCSRCFCLSFVLSLHQLLLFMLLFYSPFSVVFPQLVSPFCFFFVDTPGGDQSNMAIKWNQIASPWGLASVGNHGVKHSPYCVS